MSAFFRSHSHDLRQLTASCALAPVCVINSVTRWVVSIVPLPVPLPLRDRPGRTACRSSSLLAGRSRRGSLPLRRRSSQHPPQQQQQQQLVHPPAPEQQPPLLSMHLRVLPAMAFRRVHVAATLCSPGPGTLQFCRSAFRCWPLSPRSAAKVGYVFCCCSLF